MGLVDEDQLRGRAQELVAPAVALDEVGGDDGVGVHVKDALPISERPLQAGRRRGQDQLGFDMELRRQLGLPLLGQVRGAAAPPAAGLGPRPTVPWRQRRLHRLADTDVVGDEESDGVLLEGHQKWNELVRARLNIQMTEGAEGTC